MDRKILKELLNQKDTPCVSIIVSTNLQSFKDKQEMKFKLKKLAKDIRADLKEKYNESLAQKLENAINSLIEQVDSGNLQQGIGIYVSMNYSQLVYFPFPVTDKVIINGSFEVRDIVANLNRLTHFNVLLLSKGASRLFKGIGINLNEVINTQFPYKYIEEFQREQAHSGSFYNDEKTKIEQVRLESYFRKLDEVLAGYIDGGPLILLGVEKYLSTFKKIKRDNNLILGEVKGDYTMHSIHEIESLVWPVVAQYQEDEKSKVCEMAIEAVHLNKAVTGIQEVWEIAKLGNGSRLVVEQDYAAKAQLEGAHKQLVVNGELENDATALPDAVETVIDKLLDQKDTEIHFVANDVLKDYGRIILTTRF